VKPIALAATTALSLVFIYVIVLDFPGMVHYAGALDLPRVLHD